MGLWKERSMVYKIGFLGVNIATALFIISFCSPSWAIFKVSHGAHPHAQSLGLWQICTEDLSMCTMALHSDNPGWLKAVRALECIAMFFAVAACIIGLYSNCILKAQVYSNIMNKNTETSAIVSVAFSSFGLIMFASQVRNYVYAGFGNQTGNIYWGFVIACVSTGMLLLSTAVMLLAHRIQVLAEMRLAHSGQFAHRQFSNSSFHTNVRLPDYTESNHDLFINHGSGGGPPPYEEVGADHAAPPPYAQVVSETQPDQSNCSSVTVSIPQRSDATVVTTHDTSASAAT